MAFDGLLILGSSIVAYLFLMPYAPLQSRGFWVAVALSILLYYGMAFWLKLYDKINRYTSIRETYVHMFGLTLSFGWASLITVPLISSLTLRFMALSYLFSVVLIPGSRVVWRVYHEHQLNKQEAARFGDRKKIRTLIVGAGEGGSLFVRSLQNHESEIDIVGLVDNDPAKQRRTVYGYPVLGRTDQIPEFIDQYHIEQITIAIPSLKPAELNDIVDLCTDSRVTVNLMPLIEDVIQGKLKVQAFREIEIIDLLGREEVKLDMKAISKQLTGKTILISGAGGSIGSEICRQLVRFSPKKIVLLGHGENSIYLIHQELIKLKDVHTELVPIIADIQDRERIFSVMETYKPFIVYHAAAHKHVPLVEYNPEEAVKNNIYGTKNMAEAAKANGVENFVMISTDKAVNPPNVMGATKRVAEMIVTGLNEVGKTKFVAVRFGNVLGSRGSVIPLFKEQIKRGGPITVTDFRMTRYFMTIPEASRLVLQAGALAKGGEIFVLDMGESVKIVDLAKKMIHLSGYTEKEIDIVEAGIRPGEKLYEELLAEGEESTQEKVFEKIFVGNVQNLPLTEVYDFVEGLDYENSDQLKKELVGFANINL